MIRRIMSEFDVRAGIQLIRSKIEVAYVSRPKTVDGPKPLLVAVSKTKPVDLIVEAYSVGQRHFGENYIQELVAKGSDEKILTLCPEIKWHFIGHPQSNKINKILKVPNLYMVETVDSEKVANVMNSAWDRIEREDKQPLRVLVQVNTSGEEEKSGVHPSQAVGLFKHIREKLKSLKVEGVMTIGKFGHDYSTGPNPDFICLMECQRKICEEIQLKPDDVLVSMGMSDDFVQAIQMGSSIVRVGSSIFGHRTKKST